MGEPLYTIAISLDKEDYRKYIEALKTEDANDSSKLLAFAPIAAALCILACLFSGNYGLAILLAASFAALYYLSKYNTDKVLDREYVNIVKEYTLLVYTERFVKQDAPELHYIFYDLFDILETDDAFYLLTTKKNGITVPKKDCDEEMIAFLKAKKENLPPVEHRAENRTPKVVGS